MIKQRALVLSVQDWEMTDERTGEVNSGCSILYVVENPSHKDTDSKRGHTPVSGVLPRGSFESLPVVPGLYELDFELATKKDSKTRAVSQVLKPIAAKLVGRVDVFAVLKGAAVVAPVPAAAGAK